MVAKLSKHYNIKQAVSKNYRFFDPIVGYDSLFYINPILLRDTKNPFFKNAYKQLQSFLGEIVLLLSKSPDADAKNRFFREAKKRFSFKEVSGLCIGYSNGSNAGTGLTGTLAENILKSAHQIIKAGVDDPEVLELVGFLEEGVGADRISDMISRIIFLDILKYSAAVAFEAKIKDTITINGNKVPKSPFKNSPILLVPKDILDTLPVANTYDEIDFVASFNSDLRSKIDALLKDATRNVGKKTLKKELRDILIANPGAMRKTINNYKSSKKYKSYDFEKDTSVQTLWFDIVHDLYASLIKPQDFNKYSTPQAAVQDIITKFCQLIENNGLNKVLYDDKRKPRKEEISQKIFHALATIFCSDKNLDVSPEPNGGRGPVDFKISRGKGKILVELKLSKNPKLMHGYTTQIREYIKAEKPTHAFYVVLQVNVPNKIGQLVKQNQAELAKPQGVIPQVVIINALLKKSASKA